MLHNSNKEIILKEEQEESILAIYLENEQINYIPEKDSGYTLDLAKSGCNNGVTISFDYNTWSVKTNYSNYTNTDNTRVKCSLYFKKRTFAESLVDCGALSKDAETCIKENYHLTEEVVDDKTVDHNLRFIGADPDNYVWFNNELWRIIGVMNNIDDGTGKKETRLKIIRNEAIGEYSWDCTAEGKYGNNWTNSTLMALLNTGAYYNRTTGVYYTNDGNNIVTNTIDFSNLGLEDKAKSMINNAVWGISGTNTFNDILVSKFYEIEHLNTMSWIGKIGIIHPSDYGYATSGKDNSNREACLSVPLYYWNDENYILSDCYLNNWLYNENFQWTLTPSLDSNFGVFCVGSDGNITSCSHPDYGASISPTVYLISSIKITSGAGSKENPYKLSGIPDNIR